MPALLLVGALDLSLLYHCEKVALFKYYAKPAAYDEQLVRRPPASCRSRTARTHRPRLARQAVLSSSLLNYAAPLHLLGAVAMYSDSGLFADWTITAAAYAKTRERALNVTEVVGGSTGVLDDVSDALALRHVVPVVLMMLVVIAVLPSGPHVCARGLH